MNASQFLRYLGNQLGEGAKANYYALHQNSRRLFRLAQPSNWKLAAHVMRDQCRYSATAKPVKGEAWARANAAVEWLLRAKAAAGDGGVSYGYFPCEGSQPWRPSYPESTGYIIPSLLRYAQLTETASIRQTALELGRWEADIQMDSGAVQGGLVCSRSQQSPSVFNTGMVLDGWSAAYRASGEEVFARAAIRAAEFLVQDLTRDGHFKTHGSYVVPHAIKTYNVLCAWPLYLAGEDFSEPRYKAAAVRLTEAAMREQRRNGWFNNNCLTHPEIPLLHTIAYALQGILEVGSLVGRRDCLEAVRKTLDALIPRIGCDGFIHGRFFSDWEPASLSSCLTGSAQLAVVCYRFAECTGEPFYRQAGERLLNYLKALQAMDSSVEDINGALAGSFPFFGGYMTAGYPNWATKFLLDALMLQIRYADEECPVDEERVQDQPFPLVAVTLALGTLAS